ncbi:nucleotidyltransferase family protein [Marinobacterium arenosum]|uniref:nucleotidyltransferase family protein n=1 Tax=Marinobacterium arenosum TaxID=2862496 RepID=UPI001C953E88|nr:nucleotidyltransferase family protein [Marinobacterium arenosum]MBY4675039.1 nucleotidyltransferase family protein [Marinobacterium arenosum]
MSRLAVMIMAAGRSARFGGCKLLAPVAGKPLLQHSIDSARQLWPDDLYVISGAWHPQLRAAQQAGDIQGVELIHNPDWAQGLGNSIAYGVGQLAPRHDAILIMLADQIALTGADLAELQGQFSGDNIVCSYYQNSRSVPAIFGANSFAALQHLQGDRGAKQLLYQQRIDVVECPLAAAAIDIDRRQDLAHWLAASDRR